jgi:probable HAF family extracellular repeat protein
MSKPAAAAEYQVTDLGAFNEPGRSLAYGINNADPLQAVGEAQFRSIVSYNAFLWEDDGTTMENLGDLGGTPNFSLGSYAQAINDSGEWVGSSDEQFGSWRAVSVDNFGNMVNLNDVIGDPDWLLLDARGINNSGKIVGEGIYDENGDGIFGSFEKRGFFLDGTTITLIDILSCSFCDVSTAYAINENDQVVGESGVNGQAWLYNNGSLIDLGYSGIDVWKNSGAQDINDGGQIVGWDVYLFAARHAFRIVPVENDCFGNPVPRLWYRDCDGNGTNDLMIDLGTLAGLTSGHAVALAINNPSQVVGWSTHPDNPDDLLDKYAFIWTEGKGMQDLNDLIPSDSGWTLREAWDVNDAGQIVGVGAYTADVDGDGDEETIPFRAFLLTPIEELENQSPIASAGPEQIIDSDSSCTATVTLDGSASTDPDSTPGTNDDIVSFEWYEGVTLLGIGETLDYSFSLGAYTVTLVVTDSAGETDTDKVIIRVVDTTPPELSVALGPDTLWPPNHKMVPVVLWADAMDNCVSELVCLIISVSSNEPVGKTAPDWQITGDLTVNLRAERSGKGGGREYTITVECTDASGNSSTYTEKVIVPHDKGKKKGVRPPVAGVKGK